MMRPCVPPVSESGQAVGSRNRSQDSVEKRLMIHFLIPHYFSIGFGGWACLMRSNNETYASMI
jgi:hypothetical protein